MNKTAKSLMKNIEHIIRIFIALVAQIFCFFLFASLIPITARIVVTSSVSLYTSATDTLVTVIVGVIVGAASLLTIAAYVLCALWLGKLSRVWIKHKRPATHTDDIQTTDSPDDVPTEEPAPQKKAQSSTKKKNKKSKKLSASKG